MLNSLDKAHYDNAKVDLIISIDKNDNELVYELADNYEWKYGEKIILKQQENLGLREHILRCGDIALNYDAIIMLEDDLVVSQSFYRYATQSVKFYSKESNIAGISLYSYRIAETVNRPFIPVQDDSDIYFMKVPSSWGQIWTSEQWLSFRAWYNENANKNQQLENLIPPNVISWPESSWKKYFYMYLAVTNKYFVYPRVGLSTNMGDIGTHFSEKTPNYQCVLMGDFNRDFIFKHLQQSASIYDGFYENERLIEFFKALNNVSINYYGCKNELDANYLITTKKLHYKIIKSWSLSLIPYELNIYNDIRGKDLFMYDLTKGNKNDKKTSAINMSVLKYDFPGLTKKKALYIALNEYNITLKQKLGKLFSKS